MLEPGEQVDRYVVEELLGKGGMAAVYRVRHQHLGSLHALKLLLISLPAIRTRLLQEGRVQARLRHPNIVAVTDVLLVDRSPALVMEYIDGPSLEEVLEADGALALDEALELFRGVLMGLAAAHLAGVVHRDLKPGNVLLERLPNGFVPKVMDFGLVKSLGTDSTTTVTGAALGTPAYMAPEQIRNPSAVDERADLWALGCLLYELVTHSRAFPAEDAFDLYDAIRGGDFVDPQEVEPELPDPVADMVRSLLSVEPADRPQSCAEVYEQLYGEPLQQQGPSHHLSLRGVTPAPVEPRSLPSAERVDTLHSRVAELEDIRRRERRRVLGLSALALLLLLVVFGVGVSQLGSPRAAVTDGPTARVDEVLPTDGGDVVPVQPEPVSPTPAVPADVVGAPEGPQGDPVPAPTTPVAPSPREPAPPALPAPTPQAAPSTESASGTADPDEVASVLVAGDAEELWLEQNGVRLEASATLAPGRYEVFARFSDGPITNFPLRVQAGEHITLRCTTFHFSCAAHRE